MKPTVFDSEKAMNVLLYLAIRIPEERNMYKLLKAAYRANKRHLENHGREIFNERYQALEFGAVPAFAYDVITHVRDGKPQPRMPHKVKQKLSVSENDTVTALVDPNLRLLSETDLECVDEAIQFYRGKSFDEVKSNAHEDEAYKATPRDAYIPLERIILTLRNGEVLLKHIRAA